jgi:hypothetical protein
LRKEQAIWRGGEHRGKRKKAIKQDGLGFTLFGNLYSSLERSIFSLKRLG